MMYLCDELIQVSFEVVCSLLDQCTFIPMKLSRFEARGGVLTLYFFFQKFKLSKVPSFFLFFLSFIWGGEGWMLREP